MYYIDQKYENATPRRKLVITAPTAEKPRHLTVYHSRNATQNSAIILQGQWLEASGFIPKTRCLLYVKTES